MIVIIRDVKNSAIVTETDSKGLSYGFNGFKLFIEFYSKNFQLLNTFGEKAFLPLGNHIGSNNWKVW